LRTLEHKHIGGRVVEASAPALDDVLVEIARIKGWL